MPIALQDLDFLARRDYFLVGQAVRLSPPAVAGVWLRPCCFVGQAILPAAGQAACFHGAYFQALDAGPPETSSGLPFVKFLPAL
jgi:hypothetical protein